MFDRWVPDNTFWNQKTLADAKNVIGQANGYGPLPSLAADTNTVDASLRVRGAMTFRLDDSATETLSGIKDDILHRQNDGSWSSIGDTSFSTDASTGFWSFSQFGSLAIMTNGVDTPRKWDFVSTPANTSVLGGSPPSAKYSAVFYDFLVLAHLDTEEDSLHWSAINDPEGWTVGTNSSDKQQFPEGGRIMGLHAGQRLFVLQERQVRMGTFAPGSPEIIQFEVISRDKGCTAYRGSAQIGDVVFFISENGFYVINGAQVTPISDEIVNRWFRANSRSDLRSRTICAVDNDRRLVMWSFFSSENLTAATDESTPDKTIIYHWPSKKWTYGEFGFESPIEISATAFGLEDLDSVGDLDSLTISLDSGLYNTELIGGSFSVFNNDNEMCALSGSNMEACLRLDNQQYFVPLCQMIEGVQPITDAEYVSVSLTPRRRMKDSGTMLPYKSAEDSGWCPQHNSSRFHDIAVKIEAGDDWTFVNGIIVSAEPDGEL
jgi:hypothetical protein